MPGVNYTCELQEPCLHQDGDRLPSAVIGLKAYLCTQKEKHLSQEKAAATDTSNCVRLEKWIFRFIVGAQLHRGGKMLDPQMAPGPPMKH